VTTASGSTDAVGSIRPCNRLEGRRAAHRLGWAIRLAGGGLRRAQTGVVGNYALSVVAGLLVILIVYGGYASGWLRR